MIELLILFELNRRVLTMYGISKEIHNTFSVLTMPSFGTIKPALTRLEKAGFVKTQKVMSDGGRPSVYYSVTKLGIDELRRLLLETPSENPVQFLTVSRIKLACADVLNNEEQIQLFYRLKRKAETILIDAQNVVRAGELAYLPQLVFDNLVCEYKNFVSLLEGLEHAGNRK